MDFPLSVENIIDVLTRAGSQNPTVLKPAEEQLKCCEEKSMFYSTLLAIVKNKSLDINIRWLAVLYFKNGIDRYWRKNAPRAIAEDEKCELRRELIASFEEPFQQIATQLAVLIARIARIDCPREWPQLLPTLLEAVKQAHHPLIHQRALLTLHHVVKTLASKRLQNDRKVFEELTNNIFTFLVSVWISHCQSLMAALEMQDSTVQAHFHHFILTQKVLRRMVVFGFPDVTKNSESVQYIELCFQHIDVFLKSKSKMEYDSGNLFPLRERVVILFTKLFLDLQNHQPTQYVMFILPTLHFVSRFVFTNEGQGLTFERLIIHCFNLLEFLLRCQSYKPSRLSDADRPLDQDTGARHQAMALAASQCMREFFTVETLKVVCRSVIYHYLPLTPQDLHLWDSDPEGYVIGEEAGDCAQFSFRPCVDSLFKTLLREYREVLVPFVVENIQAHMSLVNPEDLPAILEKDAIYNAAGLGSFELFDEINFDEWFNTYLISELSVAHSNYRIIRRRVAILLGCWVGVRLSVDQRPTLYQVLVPLLQSSEDLVVRIEAAMALKQAVDDFDFQVEQFEPFLEEAFSALFVLLKTVTECESKMRLLHVMSFVIERMQAHIRDHIPALTSYLPDLWDESLEHHLLRCAIINTLQVIVSGLGERSSLLYPTLLPIIDASTDTRNPEHVYLYEDAVDLWLETLYSARSPTPGLLELYKNMETLLELGSESLGTCLKIIEAYILLDPHKFLTSFGPQLQKSLCWVLSDLKTDGVILVLKAIERAFKIAPQEALIELGSMLVDFTKDCLKTEEYPLVKSLKLSLLATLVMFNVGTFMNLIDTVTQQLQDPTFFSKLIKVWCSDFESLSQPDRKKLLGIGLVTLLTTQRPEVLENFGVVIAGTVEILHDICDYDDLIGKFVDSCKINQEDRINFVFSDESTHHLYRKQECNKQDMVFRINIIDYVREQLHKCHDLYGHENMSKLMNSVDPIVLRQLEDFITEPDSE